MGEGETLWAFCVSQGGIHISTNRLDGLSKKGGSIGAQIKATLRFLLIPALLPAGIVRDRHIFYEMGIF